MSANSTMSISTLYNQFGDDTTVPRLFDVIARNYPEHVAISIPKDEKNPSRGWKNVTFRDLASAIDKAASWLLREIGHQSESFETIHYMLPQDLSVIVFMLASAKIGFKGLFCHPRCTTEALVYISTTMETQYLVSTSNLMPEARMAVESLTSIKSEINVITAPPLHFWFATDFPQQLGILASTKSTGNNPNDPFTVIHSSGTTGNPKAIVMTHRHLLRMAKSFLSVNNKDDLNYERFRGKRVALLSPVSSAAGLYFLLGLNFVYDFTSVLPPAPGPLSADKLEQTICYANVTCVIAPPKIFPDIAKCSRMLALIKSKIDSVGYIGAACPNHAGEAISTHTQLYPLYGSTETGMYPLFTTVSSDWAYMKWDSSFTHQMRPIASSNYYHLVLPRDVGARGFQIGFELFPSFEEWNTNDIFVRHPDPAKDDHWRYVGRMEDVIICRAPTSNSVGPNIASIKSRSSLLMPNEMEHMIERHPSIAAAVICDCEEGVLHVVIEPVGLGQTQGPRPEEADKTQALIAEIWSSIEQANAICSIPAQIHRSSILLALEPLPKGTKGYPQRNLVRQRYRET
ncbi:acetyl-CoA synthetase-like protein [Pseudovirgaria hyperparasitica]|uniref:Acetyl-CoA synthetase-like protein n=1 Tax=Pseudovirgaria hyperparasitica TaxID=470096 RepID=A0A6A6VXT7_9PEZI|nr:acetyl-CoA synthetase-like protein [Pseudovirgaria hyperparasitica]KAF2754639.1 acetyl-CoA synthetase-like protein [Pseudovirgaria hyperparasitica]